ncbi:hypothetical protein [Megalodesulfovibrio gigas]|uniref:Uncharacterized protein n=1 Tax=Megalodesulfovibrio gigas (strain ATCC 19364 / DSM 1382 / NCIMB 9332 / VKM B-1759) TaxID=1121448 RepID=T2GB62_MEGG1|nr:hypothetical protein [Megalodesulfovibrio gigas]AGW13528.1 hypothetical protein DGI_1711 [Megalodesulfovibrio gigas DSM 1382 = ATCC 19364]
MNTEHITQHVVGVIRAAFSTDMDARTEALREFLSVVAPKTLDSPIERWCAVLPSCMPSLYEKWATMFAERMVETIPHDQLQYLCNGEQENDAALKLAFVMFMESARMEQQMPLDIAAVATQQCSPEEEVLLQTISHALASRLRSKDTA